MFTYQRVLFLLFCVCFQEQLCFNKLLSHCEKPINIYNNLECVANSNSCVQSDKTCPECFDCSQITSDGNRCFFHGNYYDIGERIDRNEVLPTCSVSCVCTKDLNFACDVLSCAALQTPEGCYETYGLDQCCPIGYNCPTNKTFTCHTNEGTVYEGQTFVNPKDECSICVCNKGVTGRPGDHHCRRIVCDVEIHQSNLILQYCAPLYISLSDCCPFDYICPEDIDHFEISNLEAGIFKQIELDPKVTCDENECHQCRYGDNCYNVGTKFTRRESFTSIEEDEFSQVTNCECVIPPYFTCIRENFGFL